MKESIYHKYHDAPYVGKHEKKWYIVHQVLSPEGPCEAIQIYGLDAAKDAVKDSYRYKIVTLDGRTVCKS